MKKIVCIVSVIALLLLNYGTTVFAETTEISDVNKLPEILADGNKMYPEVCDGNEVYYCRYYSDANGTIKIWSGGAMETFRRIYDENMNLLISNNDLQDDALKDAEGYGGLAFEVEAGKTYVIAVGMYETNIVPENICFWVNFSASNQPTESTDKATEPTSEEPAKPVTTEPTEPTTDIPTESVTTESTEPTTDIPTEPVTTEPTEPTTDKPAATEPQPTVTDQTTPTVKTAVKKQANTVKVTAKNKKVKAKKLKSKKQSVKPLAITNAQGKVTVTLVKSGTTKKIRTKITVSKKGVITLKKGKYKKETYKIKLKITAAGNSEYKPKTLSKTVKIKIK